MKFSHVLTILIFTVLFALPGFTAGTAPAGRTGEADPVKNESGASYYVEISISRNLLTLFEKKAAGELVQVAEYPVGTAVVGLKTFPIGLGRVTNIQFNPWWYPTAYSRQVFRERGINLPSAVPPGDPLNYMGPFKISLSHSTWKGAIYRIHGNNNPKRVGRRVTGGCFVMDNVDGMALAHRLRVGTEVKVVP